VWSALPLELHLPIANVIVNPMWVLLLGTIVGFLSGLFGVGGGFLVTPMLNIVFRVPYNVAAGSGLAQILGTSVSATAKHRGLGNVDVKLGSCVFASGCIGAECGARVVELLESAEPIIVAGRDVARLELFVPVAFLVLLSTVGTITLKESRRARRRAPRGGVVETPIANRLRNIRIPPTISLRAPAIESISLWILLGIGLATGFVAGFLGVGGGFVLMPLLVYGVGVPTTVAIGTGLFQAMLLSSFGTLTHALKGNVDLVLVLLLLAGSVIGAQFGASLIRKVRAAKIRYWFSLIVFSAAMAVLVKLAVQLGLFGTRAS